MIEPWVTLPRRAIHRKGRNDLPSRSIQKGKPCLLPLIFNARRLAPHR
jgi:hypothetical protein